MESKEALFHTFLYDTVSPMLGKMWVPLDFSKLGVTHPIVIFPKSPKPHMYFGKKSSKFNVMQLVHMQQTKRFIIILVRYSIKLGWSNQSLLGCVCPKKTQAIILGLRTPKNMEIFPARYHVHFENNGFFAKECMFQFIIHAIAICNTHSVLSSPLTFRFFYRYK